MVDGTRVENACQHASSVSTITSVPAPSPALREARRRELVAACRAIFDARGVAEAPVEEIAQAVGIARGLIYREFATKEELVVLTVAGYLAELAALQRVGLGASEDPAVQLEHLVRAYTGFCRRYPAFLDGQINLMRRRADVLGAELSEEVWRELGEAMAGCLSPVVEVLRRGAERGAFAVEDPELTGNLLWTQMLGAMHLARIGVGVTRDGEGGPALFVADGDRVVAACVASALASVRA